VRAALSSGQIASRSGRKSCTAEQFASLIAVGRFILFCSVASWPQLSSFVLSQLSSCISFALTQLPSKVALLCVCVDLGGSRTRLISSLK